MVLPASLVAPFDGSIDGNDAVAAESDIDSAHKARSEHVQFDCVNVFGKSFLEDLSSWRYQITIGRVAEKILDCCAVDPCAEVQHRTVIEHSAQLGLMVRTQIGDVKLELGSGDPLVEARAEHVDGQRTGKVLSPETVYQQLPLPLARN